MSCTGQWIWKPQTSVVEYFYGDHPADRIGVEVKVECSGHVLRKFNGVYDSIQGSMLHCFALTLGLTSQYLLAIASVADNP